MTDLIARLDEDMEDMDDDVRLAGYREFARELLAGVDPHEAMLNGLDFAARMSMKKYDLTNYEEDLDTLPLSTRRKVKRMREAYEVALLGPRTE